MKPGRELLPGGHAACLLPRGREFTAEGAKLGPSATKAGPLTGSWQAGGASSACCRVRAALLLLCPCSRVAQGCRCLQLWSLCPLPVPLGSLDVTRSGYKPAQLPAVPGAGWHSNGPGREVGELTLATASPTAPHQHPHQHLHTLPTGEELAGGTRLCSQHGLDGKQLDTASFCQCHSHWVAEVSGCIAFKGKACAFTPASHAGWSVGPHGQQQSQVLVQPTLRWLCRDSR